MKIAASMHGGSVKELVSGNVYPLIACGAFDNAVFIEDRHIGRIYGREELIRFKEVER